MGSSGQGSLGPEAKSEAGDNPALPPQL